MAQWLLIAATVLAILGGTLGLLAVRSGFRSPWTLLCMLGAFACQLGVLLVRGEMRGKCPLGDYGEILAFLAWSLVLFYLVIGPTYRISLLGLFTAPVVAIFTAGVICAKSSCRLNFPRLANTTTAIRR